MMASVINGAGSVSVQAALLCTCVSLVLGLVIAAVYMLQGEYTKNFVVTLLLLPALVQAVIMLVNGNLGTGVAIMGAFSLVRFRSVPGTSREISGVFYAIVVGLATGMGYLAYAVMITVIVGAVMLVSYKVVGHAGVQQHLLRIVISEDLDYEGVFEDILQKYTKTARLIQVKTINMGSMYELRYEIALAKDALVKEMIDDIRTRNSNLTVSCSRVLTSREEL
jgi:uncharacterized membrane protein YhiD involved in acid resistance